jgi:hypothetical protein
VKGSMSRWTRIDSSSRISTKPQQTMSHRKEKLQKKQQRAVSMQVRQRGMWLSCRAAQPPGAEGQWAKQLTRSVTSCRGMQRYTDGSMPQQKEGDVAVLTS